MLIQFQWKWLSIFPVSWPGHVEHVPWAEKVNIGFIDHHFVAICPWSFQSYRIGFKSPAFDFQLESWFSFCFLEELSTTSNKSSTFKFDGLLCFRWLDYGVECPSPVVGCQCPSICPSRLRKAPMISRSYSAGSNFDLLIHLGLF